MDVLSDRGHIVMRIPVNATLNECRNHRKRHHRIPILNRVEMEIERYKVNTVEEEDMSMWKNGKRKYRKDFSSIKTWQATREKHKDCSWSKVVWFRYATPTADHM